MQAEVAVLLKSGSLEDNDAVVSNDLAGMLTQEAGDTKTQEKKKPLKIDFSAYCDCV